MLDGSRFFAEFPDENPDRAPMNPAVLCALVALEREISRIIRTEPETRSRLQMAMPVVPNEVRQFGHRKDRVGALPNVEIPGFLKRGPRTEQDVMS
jgi:hypothetical protein